MRESKETVGPKRNRRLSDEEVEEIIALLDGWVGKLRWETVVEKLSRRWAGRTYSRQGLDKHARIKDAFQRAKARQQQSPISHSDQPLELVKALERVRFLQAQNEGLTAENNRFREQFVRWAYNAHTKGFDERYLNTPLPTIDRHPSRKQ